MRYDAETMTDRLIIALAQLNPIVGGVAANLAKAKAEVAKLPPVDLVLFPELFMAGYPPEDLVLRPSFVKACKEAVEELAREFAAGPAILMGLPWRDGDKLHNAVAFLNGGKIETLRYKFDLPNYGVFDEKRVFQPGPAPGPISFKGVRIGVPICEDIWTEETSETLAETGAEILLSPNGSPFERNKDDVRLNLVVARVTETGLPLAYLNQVGGQDELVFDGASFVLNADRSLALQMPMFEEAVAITEWRRGEKGWHMVPSTTVKLPENEEETWKACVLGLRDYVDKNKFPGVVLGLSGQYHNAHPAGLHIPWHPPNCLRLYIHKATSRNERERLQAHQPPWQPPQQNQCLPKAPAPRRGICFYRRNHASPEHKPSRFLLHSPEA